jgi:hypothetical protein
VKKLLDWFCVLILAVLLLGMGIYILVLQDKCQRLQDLYLRESLVHVGHIYVHKLDKYKADHGTYPDSLDVLFPSYITQENLLSIYASQINYLQDHPTREQWEQMRQSKAPKCSWWDGWQYTPDPAKNSFELYIVYKDSGSSNTLEYVPVRGDLFIGTSVSVIE